MAKERVRSVIYTEETHSDVIAVLNELVELQDIASATKHGERLILDAGRQKIKELRANRPDAESPSVKDSNSGGSDNSSQGNNAA